MPEQEKKKVGRPRKETRVAGGSETARQKGQVGLLVNLQPAQRAALRAAAGLANQPMNEFAREAILSAVESALTDANMADLLADLKKPENPAQAS